MRQRYNGNHNTKVMVNWDEGPFRQSSVEPNSSPRQLKLEDLPSVIDHTAW